PQWGLGGGTCIPRSAGRAAATKAVSLSGSFPDAARGSALCEIDLAAWTRPPPYPRPLSPRGRGEKRAALLRLALGGVGGRPVGLAHPHGAHLVLGDLRDRVLGRDRHLVDALRPGPVVRHEH